MMTAPRLTLSQFLREHKSLTWTKLSKFFHGSSMSSKSQIPQTKRHPFQNFQLSTMQLKILSWNAQSIRNKSDLFNHLQSETIPYHLILIQETWLNPKVDFKYPSLYTCLRKDRTNNKKKNSQCPHLGVLILILKSLAFKVVPTAPLLHVEAFLFNS